MSSEQRCTRLSPLGRRGFIKFPPLEGQAAPPPWWWCLLGDLCFLCGFDSWLISRTRPTYVLEVLQSGPPRLAPYPNPPPITLFFDVLNSLAQTKEPTAARTILMPRACNRPMVNHCAKIWAHCCPTHEERGQSCWRVWQRRLILLLCVVLFLCVCRNLLVAIWLVETQSGTSQNGQLLCNHNRKSTTKPPQCNDMSFLSALEDSWDSFTFWVECNFGCVLTATKCGAVE